MNRFQEWSLKRLIKIIVRNHQLETLFRILRDECEWQWYEDNDVTREHYIREALEKTAPELHQYHK